MLLPLAMDAFPEEGCDDTRPCMPLSPVLEMPPEFPDEDTNLLPCSICNRTFNPVSLQRHEKVCEKLQTKKRKFSPSHAFDSTKQRQEGLDPTGRILRDPKNTPPPPKVKSRWREKHKEFLKTIRAAKSTSDDENDDQKSVPSDYIKCPHCERHFGPKSADRHISWCSEQKTRLPRYHTNEDVEAVQRLKTRIKYTPPKPGQSGWRAPKRKDVISSIPPPNVGANITPPGRLISPPPPAHSNRHMSPPPAHPPPHRNWSPPFISSTRRNTLSSLPPGPPKYGGTSSLGRSAGKHFQAMMQSMSGSGYNSNYGLSPGGGSIHAIYGSTSGSSTPNYGGQHNYFNRSASLKLPRRRPAGGTRMARHRDLAMDMLASVSVDGSKREEPEGDESHDMTRSRENFSYNKMEKEKINELKRNNESGLACSSTNEESNAPPPLGDVDLDYLNLEFIRSKRKALDEEIRRLADQLQTSNFSENGEKEALVEKGEKELIDNGFNEDLDFTSYESDEDLDIPTEENFLKSSTSISGDDDISELLVSRPRSVHFEDEYWNDSQFVSDYDLTSSSGNTSGTSQVWSVLGSDNQTESGDLAGSVADSPSNPFLTKQKVPPLKSPNKESVREILRKRREENVINKVDLDSRRRIQPIQNMTQERSQSRSRSKDCRPKSINESKSSIHSSQSLENCSIVGTSEHRFNRPIKHIGPKASLNSSGIIVEPVISRKEYAHYRALVGSRGGIIKESYKEISKSKRPAMQLKVAKVPEEFSSGRLEDKSYDPYSAAELQFQDLLGPLKSGVGLRAGMMLGSTSSLQSLNYNKLHSLERDFSPPKRNSLRGLGSLSLCSLGLDTLDITSHDLKSPGDDSSELESLGDSSQGMQSPENELDELLASPSNEHPPSSQVFKSGKFNEKDDSRNNSINNSRSRTVSSQSIRLPFDENTHSDRKVPDGSYSFSKSPSPSFNFDSFRRSISKERTSPSKSPPSYNFESFRRSTSKEQTPPPKPPNYNFDSFRRSTSKEQTPPPKSPPFTFDSIRRSFSKERTPPIKSPSPYNYESGRRSVSNERTSPPYQPSLGPTSDFKKSESPSSVNANTNSYVWTAASDHVGSPQSYSRYFGTKPQPEVNGCNKTPPNYSATSYESLKALRASLDEDNKSQNTMMHRLDESMQRVSSGSSTDSSLPPLSSPVPSSSTLRTQSLNPSSGGSYAMPKFCYECGNKYPIMQARFCCQCGAPRVTIND